jgi:hypothetical protein
MQADAAHQQANAAFLSNLAAMQKPKEQQPVLEINLPAKKAEPYIIIASVDEFWAARNAGRLIERKVKSLNGQFNWVVLTPTKELENDWVEFHMEENPGSFRVHDSFTVRCMTMCKRLRNGKLRVSAVAGPCIEWIKTNVMGDYTLIPHTLVWEIFEEENVEYVF